MHWVEEVNTERKSTSTYYTETGERQKEHHKEIRTCRVITWCLPWFCRQFNFHGGAYLRCSFANLASALFSQIYSHIDNNMNGWSTVTLHSLAKTVQDGPGTTFHAEEWKRTDTNRILLNLLFPHFHATWPNNEVTRGRRGRRRTYTFGWLLTVPSSCRFLSIPMRSDGGRCLKAEDFTPSNYISTFNLS